MHDDVTAEGVGVAAPSIIRAQTAAPRTGSPSSLCKTPKQKFSIPARFNLLTLSPWSCHGHDIFGPFHGKNPMIEKSSSHPEEKLDDATMGNHRKSLADLPRSLRILHVMRSVDPRAGGPVEGVKQLAGCYQRDGHQVEVVSLDASDAPFLASFPLPVTAVGPGRGKYGRAVALKHWLRAQLPRFDVVVVNGIWQYHSLAARSAARRAGKPYVVFTHGMLDPWFRRQYPLKHLKKWLYWPWADYRVLRDADAVLFTSDAERRLARRSFWLYRVREVVVSYGTSAQSHDAATIAAQRAAFLQQYPQLAERRVLLYLGRIHEKKGCDLLVRAFAQIAGLDPRLHLVMAGPDADGLVANLTSAATALGVAERITWTGMLTGDQKWGAFRSAEAFVLPSHQENFGIAVVEALACGVPVLISHQVNIWREIVADHAGLVASDDQGGIDHLLMQWQGLSAGARAAMAGHARACFLNRFEISRAARGLVALLDGLIRAPRSAARRQFANLPVPQVPTALIHASLGGEPG